MLQLNPGFPLQALASQRGRFHLRNAANHEVRVTAVQVEISSAGGAEAWRVEFRDQAGASVGSLEFWPEARTEAPRLEALTRRQREILELVAQGCAVKTIASRLQISVKTVEFHKTRLMRRLGMHGTAELTRFAVASGLVPV